MNHRLKFWLPLLLIIIVAVAFRFPLLDSLPPGLNFDEGGEGIAALDVTHGRFRVWWPIGGGKEPLMAYLVQPLFWLFGPTRLALRLYTALMGLGAVLGTYFLAGQLFPTNTDDDAPFLLLPTFAALGLATAFWHVAYSRIAFRALSNPMVEALALAFLWRALRTTRWRDFLLAGFFTGGLIYTYLAGRFVPVAVALFFVVEGVLAWRTGRQPLLLQYWRKLAGMVGVATLVFAPVGLFFAQNPAAFVERAGSVSIFSPEMNQGDFWGILWRTVLTTLGTFLSLTGDPNPLGNIPGKPELCPIFAAFFVLGIAACLFYVLRPPPPAPRQSISGGGLTPHASSLFLLLWWPIMLLPAILAPENPPHHLRLIGAGPATYILVGLGLVQLVRWGSGWLSAREKSPPLEREVRGAWDRDNLAVGLGWLLVIIVFGLTAAQTYNDYFIRWANDVDHYMDFDVYAEELASQIAAESDPHLAYAIPMDLRAAHEARHYSLDFLYRGQTPYTYVVVDETTVAQSLTQAAQGKVTLKVVRWVQDKHREADARQMVAFLLETGGAVLTELESYPVYNVETYRLLNPQTEFALPAIETPIDAALDGLIQVRRATVLPRPTLNSQAAVGVTYAPIAPLEVDYKASLRLIGPGGETVAQKDRLLLHNWHQGTSLWPREEVNEYYLLPLPPDAPLGNYEVRLVIYHPDTLAPLTDNGQVEIRLGNIELTQ